MTSFEKGKLKANIEFLISQYEREIKFEERQKQVNYNSIEIYESIISDLENLIDFM